MKHRSGHRPCLPVPCSLQPSRLLGNPSCHPVPLSQLSRERHRQNLGVHSTKPSLPLREVWGGHRHQLSHLAPRVSLFILSVRKVLCFASSGTSRNRAATSAV